MKVNLRHAAFSINVSVVEGEVFLFFLSLQNQGVAKGPSVGFVYFHFQFYFPDPTADLVLICI